MAGKKRSKSSSRKSKKTSASKKKYAKSSDTRVMNRHVGYDGLYPEKKFWDMIFSQSLTLTGLTVNQVPNSTDPRKILAGIIQGQSSKTRIGNKITLTNVNISGRIASVALTAVSRVRVIFYLDRQNNSVDRSLTAFAGLLDTTLTAGLINLPDSFRDMDQVARFKILKDKTYVITPAGTAASVVSAGVKFKMSWKGSQVIHFNGNAGTFADLPSEDIGVLFVPDVAGSLAAGAIRVKFHDC